MRESLVTHKVIPPEQGLKHSINAIAAECHAKLAQTHKVIPPEQGLKQSVPCILADHAHLLITHKVIPPEQGLKHFFLHVRP